MNFTWSLRGSDEPKMARAGEGWNAATIRRTPPFTSWRSSNCRLTKSPAGCQTGFSWSRRRRRFSGTLRTRLSTSFFRRSTFPCRLLHYDTPIPEQVIAVPKISSPSRCSRTVLSKPQTAKQLVDAPTLVSLVDVFEQPVDIPVGGGDGSGYGGHQGFLTGQSSSPSVEQIVDIPVLGRSSGPGGLYTLNRVQQRLPSRTLTFQLLVVVCKVLIQIRGPQRFFPDLRGDAFQGFFRTLPWRKKCCTWGRNWVRTSAHPRRRVITTTSGLMRRAACG